MVRIHLVNDPKESLNSESVVFWFALNKALKNMSERSGLSFETERLHKLLHFTKVYHEWTNKNPIDFPIFLVTLT